jgi:hypothetical protein
MSTFPVKRSWTALGAVTLIVGLIAGYYASRPQYNWDMIAYMAVALIDEGTPVASAHDEVYKIAAETVPAIAFRNLTQGTPHFILDYRDPDRFAMLLPFYTVKPLYPALIALLHKAGVNLVAASLTVTATFYVATCLLLFFWISRWVGPLVSAPLTCLIAFLPYLTVVLRLATPDMMSLFFIMLGVYGAIERKSTALCIVAFALAVAARPESIIYSLGIAAYVAVTRKTFYGPVAWAAVSLALYGLETRLSGNYGWKTLMYYTFVDSTVDLPNFRSPLGVADYLKIYFRGIDDTVFSQSEGFGTAVLLAFGAVARKLHARDWRNPYLQLVFLAFVFMAARTLILPADAYRALLPAYMMILVAFVQACVAAEARAAGLVTSRV